MSHHVWECDNKNKNRSRPVFIFDGAVACWLSYSQISEKSLPNGHASTDFHVWHDFIFWLVSHVTTLALNALLHMLCSERDVLSMTHTICSMLSVHWATGGVPITSQLKAICTGLAKPFHPNILVLQLPQSPWIGFCLAQLQAKVRPSQALFRPSQAGPRLWLGGGFGLAWNFQKPKPMAWAKAFYQISPGTEGIRGTLRLLEHTISTPFSYTLQYYSNKRIWLPYALLLCTQLSITLAFTYTSHAMPNQHVCAACQCVVSNQTGILSLTPVALACTLWSYDTNGLVD